MPRSHKRGSRLLRALLLVAIAGVVGQVVAKRKTFGDEDSDAFGLAAIVGGREFTSRARALRSGSALAVMGGVEIDLRNATLDPQGATLTVTAVMGGVEVTLPHGWRVELETDVKMAGLEANVTDPADLPDDAPTLRLTVTARMGGVEVDQERSPLASGVR
jgi:hypothetical protein